MDSKNVEKRKQFFFSEKIKKIQTDELMARMRESQKIKKVHKKAREMNLFEEWCDKSP